MTRAPDAVRDAIEAARSDGYTADDGLRVLVSSRFEGDWSLAGELEDDFDAMDRSGDGGGASIDEIRALGHPVDRTRVYPPGTILAVAEHGSRPDEIVVDEIVDELGDGG